MQGAMTAGGVIAEPLGLLTRDGFNRDLTTDQKLWGEVSNRILG